MFVRKKIILIFIVIAMMLSCNSGKKINSEKSQKVKIANNINIKTISIKESRKMIKDRIDDKNFVLLDIRTPKEFNEFHIDKAINIDYYNRNFKNELEKLDKSRDYLIYCRSAHRSKAGLKIMKELGFKSVVDMDGGITKWLKNR